MAEPRRILILHASCGAGHARAAEAVERALGAHGRTAEVLVVDALRCTPASFRRVYNGAYEVSVREAPWAFGAAYRAASAAARLAPFRACRRALNRVAARRLGAVVAAFDPDAVLCTHFLPLDFLARWKAAGRLRAPLACAVTDYVAHGFWAEPRADRYYVATPAVGRELARRGCRPERTLATGIPVDEAFAAIPPLRAGPLAAQGERRRVLVLAGGLGMGPVVEVVRSLTAGPGPLEVVAVCGRNEALRREVEALGAPVQALGFRTDLPDLMAAADVVVTKPGGLTTTEALAAGRPLVLFEAMPGQEEGNARWLVGAGAALRASEEEVGQTVRALLAEPSRLQALAARARAVARPFAAREIARDLLALARAGAAGSIGAWDSATSSSTSTGR